MDDPLPQNIGGEKVEVVTHEFSHNVDHHIPYGQVMLGIAGIGLAVVLYKMFLADSGGGDEDQPDFEPGDVESIDVKGDGLMTSRPW